MGGEWICHFLQRGWRVCPQYVEVPGSGSKPMPQQWQPAMPPGNSWIYVLLFKKVISLITFPKNYVAISFTLGSTHKLCSSFSKPPKLWLHSSSLITSPHEPFIYLLKWKQVIGLETVLTCFVGYSSASHSSGIPFSYKWLQFPVEVFRWVGDLPHTFVFSANTLQVFLPSGSSGNNLSSGPTAWKGRDIFLE